MAARTAIREADLGFDADPAAQDQELAILVTGAKFRSSH
jgi:hypothetical protein